jgi:hypothetical protein
VFCGFLFLEWGRGWGWGWSGEQDDLLLLDKLLEGKGFLINRTVLIDS